MQSPPTIIKSRLFSLLNNGIKYDLSRMSKASQLFGNPHRAYKSIHVAGTNGKGSVCTYIESILRAAKYKTGLYTSPHITDFEERFRIDGANIDEGVWYDVYNDMEGVINSLGLTFFEAATLMSFEIFKRAGVHYAVFETGMGGRLDATNIITPEICVITKLALDHREYLGDTLLEIAGEKLGIVKSGVPVVMLDPADEAIKSLAADKCRAAGSELTFVCAGDVDDVVCDAGGMSFVWKNERYDLSLYGSHQIQNALLALNAVERNADIDIDYGTVYSGLKSASIPGRFQVVDVGGRTVVFDVGHNPNAAAVLAGSLKTRFSGRRVLFVIGVMKDKDASAILAELFGCASSFYFAKPDISRAADPADLCALTAEKFCGKVVMSQGVANALRTAFDDACEDDIVCVTGSFYTVSEAFAAVAMC